MWAGTVPPSVWKIKPSKATKSPSKTVSWEDRAGGRVFVRAKVGGGRMGGAEKLVGGVGPAGWSQGRDSPCRGGGDLTRSAPSRGGAEEVPD